MAAESAWDPRGSHMSGPMVSRLSSGTATVVGGDGGCRRAHHAYLAAAATRPEAPIASSPNARLRRLITRDNLAEATRLVDRSRGEAPDTAVVKTNAGEVHEPKHQAHTAMDSIEVVSALIGQYYDWLVLVLRRGGVGGRERCTTSSNTSSL
uniref:Uncharacterized protein n=1 Tax=Oryza glaberrima TaxID=4538 RepID=I1NPN4_ORYGL